MTWVFPEILIPLLLALGLGVLIGWLLWRWRRRSIHASEWNQLTTNANQAKADVAATRAAYEETNNERSILANQVTSLTNDLEGAREAETSAVERAENSFADLEISKHELSQATDQTALLETELLAATTSTVDRDALDQEIVRLRTELDEEVGQLRDELESGAVRRSQLEQAVEERDHELERTLGELNGLTSRTETLQADLASKSKELTTTLDDTALQTARITELESGAGAATSVTELEAALAAARTELDVSQSRIADFDARLSTTNADLDAAHLRVSELEAQAQAEETGGAERIGQLRVELAERDRRIMALDAATAGSEPDAEAEPERIGISVADHIDDLKVIRGIGPRMEELLTTVGVTSWEQLAGLDEAGVAEVDNALREFPGRIERDQWVDQARELVSRFPNIHDRPTRKTFLNRTKDEDPFN